MGDRYKLIDKVMFVDATKQDGPDAGRKPSDIPHPHILDQNQDPAKYLCLNDEAGFVARFIVQGVDTGLIKEIIRSEYDNKVPDPQEMVDAVVGMLKPYLEKRTKPRQYDPPKVVKEGNFNIHTKKYDLDFSANWFGTGWIKF